MHKHRKWMQAVVAVGLAFVLRTSDCQAERPFAVEAPCDSVDARVSSGPLHYTAQELPSAPVPSPDSFNPNADGVYKVGGDVRAPVVIYSVDPEFTELARKKRFSGNVQVALIVDEKGIPRRVRVPRGVGMGLDEKAVEAVRQYRFKPAMKGDTPVPVQILVEVNFQIF